jgi:hypothetical protein
MRTTEGPVTGRVDGDVVHELSTGLDELVRGPVPAETGRSVELDPAALVAPVQEGCRGLM